MYALEYNKSVNMLKIKCSLGLCLSGNYTTHGDSRTTAPLYRTRVYHENITVNVLYNITLAESTQEFSFYFQAS